MAPLSYAVNLIASFPWISAGWSAGGPKFAVWQHCCEWLSISSILHLLRGLRVAAFLPSNLATTPPPLLELTPSRLSLPSSRRPCHGAIDKTPRSPSIWVIQGLEGGQRGALSHKVDQTRYTCV